MLYLSIFFPMSIFSRRKNKRKINNNISQIYSYERFLNFTGGKERRRKKRGIERKRDRVDRPNRFLSFFLLSPLFLSLFLSGSRTYLELLRISSRSRDVENWRSTANVGFLVFFSLFISNSPSTVVLVYFKKKKSNLEKTMLLQRESVAFHDTKCNCVCTTGFSFSREISNISEFISFKYTENILKRPFLFSS